MVSINEEFLDAYSIILRLRGIYTAEMLLSGKEYSYAGFKRWVMEADKGNISEEDFEKAYSAYNKIKNNSNASVEETSLRQLLSILKDKTEKIWRKINA